ncbi:hypothetical protein dsx2_0285 [Desulfovibrio sp. X2]|uniref:UshA-like (seleno)protein family 2 n=1 Tax=Desulfovibrio sp. X2 TaxID=941449 RepID=UPI00035882C5|nr:hypothetical protein [Desulfovibrio sp. X2]EPR42358.1 hypothetical protein dsx2_0285 [Desulfovibrio sp. X2]
MLLPEVTTPSPTAAQFDAAAAAAKELRGKAKLVIGLSPWDVDAEQVLLSRPDNAFDIFVGSGRGRGIVGMFTAFDKTLWVRPYAEGKAVGSIEVLAWPDRSPDFKWKQDANVRFTVVPLKDDLPDDPDTAAVLTGVVK